MKTRLTSVTYLGFTAMDRRFSNAMLPWLLKEIRATGIKDKLSIVVEEGYLKAYNGNFEPVIVHRLVDIIRASQVPGRPEELFYILHNEKEGLLNCFLYRASTVNEVSELFSQMREPSPGAPRAHVGSPTVAKNMSFSHQSSSEHLPWNSNAVATPRNCNSHITNESQPPLLRNTSNASALMSLSADLSPSDSHFFEVLYIGKVRISQRKVPETLIDDALQKFTQHEAEKALKRRHSLVSSTGTSLYSDSSRENLTDDNKTNNKNDCKNVKTPSTTPLEPRNIAWKSEDLLTKPKTKDNIDEQFDMFSKERIDKIGRPNVIPLEPASLVLNIPKNLGTVDEDDEKNDASKTDSNDKNNKGNKEKEAADETDSNTDPFTALGTDKNKLNVLINKVTFSDKFSLTKNVESKENAASSLNFEELPRKINNSFQSNKLPENKPFLRDRSASIGTITCKTPIAQLIGEQNRTMLFQVARTELRLISPDRKQILLHRAFTDVASCVLGRTNTEHFGFICRETNESYACYVFKCESQAVATEVVNAIKQAFVAHAELLKKTRERSPNMTCEHCPMLWYHRLCHDVDGMNEKKTHAFILRRIEQLPEEEQELIIAKYQGGTNHMYETSEHNSFLMMLLRAHCEAKQLRHVHDTAENRSEFLNQYLGGSTIFMKAKRSLSSGFDHLLKRRSSRDDGVNIKKESSPMPMAYADSLSEPSGNELRPPDIDRSKSMSPAIIVDDAMSSPKSNNSPPLEESNEEVTEVGTPVNSPMMDIFLQVSDSRPPPTEAGAEPEATWRQAIYEKVLQPDVQAEGELSATLLRKPAPQGRRSKEELRQLWKMAIDQTILLVRMEKENEKLKVSEESSAVRRIKLEYAELGACDAGVTLMWDSLLVQPPGRADPRILGQAVRQGVPRMSRGAVWHYLAEQACLASPPPDTQLHPLYHTSYRTLLAGLTKHQHAILIDLGRTFPKHSYFASALGPGQLGLYNILKAYSLLDPEVGYCQGLSFVAGVLLLHMEEAEAFVLLRHLMFRRGFRKQYLPDMSALQVQLYQLSRLLRDHEPELHAKLESLDISPALYAAPWMLTLFTSQFPLGFVVRVFDLIFLESIDIVFAVSLALLAVHKDGLMLCESCEEAAEYLKHKLPDLAAVMHDKVMKKVHQLDIHRQLCDYAVEYSVLREEMPRLAAMQEENRLLVADASRMTDELDSAMDAINSYEKSQTRLESQNKMMEQQLTLLSRYISSHHRADMPAEIKKTVQNYSKKITFSTKIFSSKFTSNDDDERRTSKTGMSSPNLFSKIRDENKDTRSPERFMIKKSLSVHSGLIANKPYPMKVLEESNESISKEEDTKVKRSPERFVLKKSLSMHSGLIAKDDSIESIPTLNEIGKKNSGFFANTHEQIRQERLFEQQLKNNFDENLRKLDEKLSQKLTPKSYIDDINLFQGRKSMSLNLSPNSKVENTKFLDSGFVTPMSPEHDKKEESPTVISHPLSDCDVDIKFDGQLTKLKQIRPVKSISLSSK